MNWNWINLHCKSLTITKPQLFPEVFHGSSGQHSTGDWFSFSRLNGICQHLCLSNFLSRPIDEQDLVLFRGNVWPGRWGTPFLKSMWEGEGTLLLFRAPLLSCGRHQNWQEQRCNLPIWIWPIILSFVAHWTSLLRLLSWEMQPYSFAQLFRAGKGRTQEWAWTWVCKPLQQ